MAWRTTHLGREKDLQHHRRRVASRMMPPGPNFNSLYGSLLGGGGASRSLALALYASSFIHSAKLRKRCANLRGILHASTYFSGISAAQTQTDVEESRMKLRHLYICTVPKMKLGKNFTRPKNRLSNPGDHLVQPHPRLILLQFRPTMRRTCQRR